MKQPTTEHEVSAPTELEAVSFSVAARVAMQLGRESISNSIVAITELVKNAYDADAETVRILFSGLDSNDPFLVIEDDGNGMTEKQLRENWMVLGTANKQKMGKSPGKHRVLTGEKGLGRLGLDRLCKKTISRFFSKNKTDGVELIIDWRKYERTAQRLEDIEHKCYSISKTIKDPINNAQRHVAKGTQLILHGLKDAWTPEYLGDLRKELMLLVSPFAKVKGFHIEIDSGMNWEGVDGLITSPEMLSAAEWKLSAKIDSRDNITYVMSSPIHDRTFKSGPTRWSNKFRNMCEKPRCGPVKFELYFFSRDKANLRNLGLRRPQLIKFLDFNQGVRIYRDRFRVKPYGEPNGEGDWLRLSYRRQQSPAGVTQGARAGGWRVGYNQVVGAVFLERDKNINLVDQTNREGIVGGPAFSDLKAFAENAVRFFELNREEFERDKKETTEYEELQTQAEGSTQDLDHAIDGLKNAAGRIRRMIDHSQKSSVPLKAEAVNSLLTEAVANVKSAAYSVKETQGKLAKASDEREKDFERQKDTLANLASLGILTASFGHETLAASNLVATNAKQLDECIKEGQFMLLPDVSQRVNDNLLFIMEGSRKIESFAKFALKNVNRDKRQRKPLFLNKIARDVFHSFESSLKERNIKSDLHKVPEEVPPIRGFRIDWESVFVNFITNSVWALRDTQAQKREIRVVIKETAKLLLVRFADSGYGLEEGTSDKIFLPTFSTKRNDKGEIIGTGMGLAIVKSFVEDYAGASVNVSSPCDLGGAEFKIAIPIPNLSRRNR